MSVSDAKVGSYGLGCSREACYARDKLGMRECSIVCVNHDDAGEDLLKDDPLINWQLTK